jgi:uncharacterized protein (TIGR00255 family)
MALKSMTGYGHGESVSAGVRVDVDLSSVNRKQFDFRLNLPKPLAFLESLLMEIVHESISRGQVNGSVNVTVSEHKRQQGAKVDMHLARAFVKELRKIGGELKLKDDLGVSMLTTLPEVVQYHYVEQDVTLIRPVCEKALRQALAALVAMREREGAAIVRDLSARLAKLSVMRQRIARLAPTVGPRYRKGVLDRLKRAGIPVNPDDAAILKEIALMAERADISEEITRLESHHKQAAKMLGQNREPVGRSLDFLAQEMFREINTIGSKANDLEISRQVIEFKTELERFREQVQNVE